jgi:lipoyl(octanoyl) transferase
MKPNADDARSSDAPRKSLRVIRHGIVPYPVALDEQMRLAEARLLDQIPDTLLLLQHPPTITFGSRVREEHLLLSREELEARGIGLFPIRRGGDVTFHGPGQLVGYPIFHLGDHGRDVHRYVRALEEVLIQAIAAFGLKGERSPGQTGVWIGDEKIAAIGVELRRWVSRHGFALNVTTDLSYFDLIVPCGIADKGVTSMERLLGAAPEIRAVEEVIVRRIGEVFGFETITEESLFEKNHDG